MADAISVTLPDGSVREYPDGTTPGEVATSIGKRLGKDALAAKVDGDWWDLSRPLGRDALVEIVVPASPDGREVLRHSTAHVMAQAVTDLFPARGTRSGPRSPTASITTSSCPMARPSPRPTSSASERACARS